MPSLSSLVGTLGEDLTRHGGARLGAGFISIASYRFGCWRAELPPGPLRKLLRVPYVALHRRVRNRHRVELHYTAGLGRRVRLSERGDIVIGNHVSIGDDCDVEQGVTMGKTSDDAVGWPVIGDRVVVGPGAIVVGALEVGDDAVLGPNSVVLADVPPAARVRARPAVPMQEGTSRGVPRQRDRNGPRVPATGARRGWLTRQRLRSRRIVISDAATIGRRVRAHPQGNLAVWEGVTLGDDCECGYGVTVG
jgi:serine O-acetyltransferase